MKKKHLIPVLVFIGLAILSGCSSQSKLSKESVRLRLHPENGVTYTATAKANMMTMMEVQGQSMSMSQVMETTQSFTAKEVTDAKSVIETQVDAIKMSISQMGMKFDYDSDHPEKTSPMIAEQTKEISNSIKKSVTVTYDALGKVADKNDDLDMSQLGNVILELPEKDVTVGSKWNTNKAQNVSGTDIKVNMEYTVTAISKKSVDVSFTGTVESADVTGSYDGTASINPQTGLMMNSTTKTNISMTINEQGLTIPITVVGTTTVDVK